MDAPYRQHGPRPAHHLGLGAMTDLDCIAHQARRALATTTGGVLHVEGIGPTTCDGILLYEQDGRPRFLCEPAEPLVAIARSTPQAVLEAAAPCRYSHRTVVLCGQLSVVGSAHGDQSRVDVVELGLRSVHLEVSRGRGIAGTRVEVPLERYLTASPDPVVDAARRVIAHLNDTHADRLRRSAASRSGQPIHRILAAQVRDADDYGLALNWLDESGAHTVRLRFGRPVRSLVDLIGKLHELLAD